MGIKKEITKEINIGDINHTNKGLISFLKFKIALPMAIKFKIKTGNKYSK
jgi:hypothetical protein